MYDLYAFHTNGLALSEAAELVIHDLAEGEPNPGPEFDIPRREFAEAIGKRCLPLVTVQDDAQATVFGYDDLRLWIRQSYAEIETRHFPRDQDEWDELRGIFTAFCRTAQELGLALWTGERESAFTEADLEPSRWSLGPPRGEWVNLLDPPVRSGCRFW